jgi:hypothetical protein
LKTTVGWMKPNISKQIRVKTIKKNEEILSEEDQVIDLNVENYNSNFSNKVSIQKKFEKRNITIIVLTLCC